MLQPEAPEVTQALLGEAEFALPPLRVVLGEYIDLTRTKNLRKSEHLKYLWKLPRERAVANFEKAVPQRKTSGIDKIAREDAWSSRGFLDGYALDNSSRSRACFS